MSQEVIEQKKSELEMLNDTIEGLKHLLKLNKKKRKELRKEVYYVVMDEDIDDMDIHKMIKSINLQEVLKQ